MVEPDSYRIPDNGDILIETDGDVPFVVTGFDNGDILGVTPDGEEVRVPVEHDCHQLDMLDL